MNITLDSPAIRAQEPAGSCLCSVREWREEEEGATYPPLCARPIQRRHTPMKSNQRTTIWRELGWGALALALMMAAFLFVYLHN
jgi:hypothetical protein